MIDYVKLAEENAQIEEIKAIYKRDFGMSERDALMCAVGYTKNLHDLYQKGIESHAAKMEKTNKQNQDDLFIRGFESAYT